MKHKKDSASLYKLLLVVGLLIVAIILMPFRPHTSSAAAVVQTGGYLQGFAWANQGDPSGGAGYLCFNDAIYCPTAGVYINNDNRTLSGYAWSDNLGWISFNSNTCGTQASTDQNFNLSGWAKALNSSQTEAGGWDGCISLSNAGLTAGQNPNSVVWAVKLDGTDTYAWGSQNIGWVDFKGVTAVFTTQIGGDSTLALIANPTHVLKNQTTTLSFTVGGMAWCQITGSDGSVPYPKNFNPTGPPAKTAVATITRDTTYTLLCQDTATPTPAQHTGIVTVSLLAAYQEI